jgi:hypothetical protein
VVFIAGGLGHNRVLRRSAVGDDQSRNRICFAQPIHVRVVIIITARTQDQKVSAVPLLAEPTKGLIQIAATAHHGNTEAGLGLDVFLIPNAEVFVGIGMRHRTCAA